MEESDRALLEEKFLRLRDLLNERDRLYHERHLAQQSAVAAALAALQESKGESNWGTGVAVSVLLGILALIVSGFLAFYR